MQVTTFCADWGACRCTRRSLIRFCILLGIALVSWKRKKQSVVSRSSAELEYINMVQTACEVRLISYLLVEFGVHNKFPIPLLCENSAAIAIAKDPVFHKRIKHVEISESLLPQLSLQLHMCTRRTNWHMCSLKDQVITRFQPLS